MPRSGQTAKRERNWIDMETEALCSILLDGESLFSTTVEIRQVCFRKKSEVPKNSFARVRFCEWRTRHILKNLRLQFR